VKFLIPSFLILVNSFALADASNCYSIKDSDSKNYCLAMSHRQPSYCYSIRDSDGKSYCLAQTHSQRTYCYSIRAGDLKNQCLGIVK